MQGNLKDDILLYVYNADGRVLGLKMEAEQD